jgi:putative membrane protein
MRLIHSLCACAVLAAGLQLAACEDDDDEEQAPPPAPERDAGTGVGGTGAGGTGAGGSGVGGAGGGFGGAGGSGGVDGGAAVDGAAGDAADGGVTVLNNAEIAGVVVEINTGEISAGQLATTKAIYLDVRTFGARMVAEHSAAQARLATLLVDLAITPASSALRSQLASEAQATMQTLQTATGAAFDVAYMNSQVQMHSMALTLIDEQLIPSTTSEEMRSALTAFRATIADHLTRAQEILNTLATGGGG